MTLCQSTVNLLIYNFTKFCSCNQRHMMAWEKFIIQKWLSFFDQQQYSYIFPRI